MRCTSPLVRSVTLSGFQANSYVDTQMASKSRIRGKATSNSFVYMWIGARHMLTLAKGSRDGLMYTSMSCMILTAFMLEAYFNHLGQLRHADWTRRERKLSKTKKFKMFAEQNGLDPDMDKRPYSSLVRLFAFRDSMAHATTITEEIDLELEIGDSITQSLPGPEWQQLITVEHAEELLNDATEIVRELHQAAGQKVDPFSTGGGGIYVASAGE